MDSVKKISGNKHFGGENRRFSHTSEVCACPMNFSVYLPAAAIGTEGARFPVCFSIPNFSRAFIDLIGHLLLIRFNLY